MLFSFAAPPALALVLSFTVFLVLVKRTAKYEVPGKDGPTVLGVDAPETLFPRGLLHSSVVAYILVQKFGLGVPHYRLEQHILDQGVALDRGMMSRYVDEAGGSLGASIVHAMWQDAIQNAAVISTDATGALVQPEKRHDGQRQSCKKGHFFTAVVDSDHVLFAYTERHTQEAVRQLFGNFKGFLQSDASNVFDILERGPPKDGDTDDASKLVGCWAHCRRYFFEAAICKYQVGLQGRLRIRAIYAADDSFRKLPPAKRKLARDEHVRPLIDAFFDWVKQARLTQHGRHLASKALGYAFNQEQELRRVLADGRLPLDNTRAERSLRKVVVGRKNWMFYGSNSHAESAAASSVSSPRAAYIASTRSSTSTSHARPARLAQGTLSGACAKVLAHHASKPPRGRPRVAPLLVRSAACRAQLRALAASRQKRWPTGRLHGLGVALTLHAELRRVGVTPQLLWGEYESAAKQRGAQPYQYSQFCELYASWRDRRRLSMRQVHRPGEKLFLDYSGKKPRICDPDTGEVTEVELFVGVLGASNYTFAEATLSQTVPDFCASTVRALEYFEAAPGILVPDQLRSAVKRPDRYDPDINDAFAELGQHYGIAIIPAPPAKPKGKAKVETGVLIAQRWILTRLRNRVFFSLGELNNAIAELVEELNTRRFQKLPGTRREAFESLDRPRMKALPRLRFELPQRKKTRANVDYHVEFDERLYSVPFKLRRELIEVRATPSVVQCFHGGVRVASHRRSYARPGTPVTNPEHRPREHQDYGEWSPERMTEWAGKFGPHVAEVARRTMAQYPQPEMGFRPVLGIIRVADKHGAAAINAACQRALSVAGTSVPHRRHIEGILKRGIERAARINVPGLCGSARIPLHSISLPGASDQDPGYPVRIRSEATSTGLVRRCVGSRVGVSDLSGGAWTSRAG